MEKLLELPREERLKVAQELVESVAGDDEPIPEWHKPLIDEAVADMEANPGDEEPWEQVLASVKARLSARA